MVSPERWPQVEAIVDGALELAPDAVPAYLDRSCTGDLRLRQEVTQLLAACQEAEDRLTFLESSAGDAAPLLELESRAQASSNDLEPGVAVGAYTIDRCLGRGGMGVVYLATDGRLDRSVAIKLMPPWLAMSEAARRRLVHEAKAASRLDHPNIETIYEIGETGEGRLYIAMAYYEGETLQDRMTRGPVAPNSALHLACQIAEGLAAAHAHGIVHRDIKPSNVIVTPDGVAKIVDFGAAKVAGHQLTIAGAVPGTVAYMSPEQASAEEVGSPTDVWSLGVLLYEMLPGHRPFRGEASDAVIYAIRHDEPRPLPELRPDVPRPLARVVERCLRKDPRDRFPNGASLAKELRRIQQPGGQAPTLRSTAHASAERETQPSLVVLPFANLSADRDNEFFADGLTDELIGDLSKLGALRVICRTSAMACKGTTRDARSIAAELGVQYVVEGSVRRAGDRLRVTAQLVDASTNASLWAERYVGVLDDVFDIQERLARTIVEALKLRLTPQEDARLGARPIQNVHAHECYLRARQQMWRWRKDAIEHAIQILSNGLRIVGDNALLLATLGLAHVHACEAGVDLTEASMSQAETYAERAADLDPELPELRLLRGWIQYMRGRIGDAVREFQLVLAADPNNPEALVMLSNCYLISGRGNRARPLVERYVAVDPLNPIGCALRGWADADEGRHAAAIASYREMLDMDPSNPMARLFCGWSLIQAGRLDAADAVLGGFEPDVQSAIPARFGACLRAALAGRIHDDLRVLADEIERAGPTSDLFARFLAQCYGLLGDAGRTVYWLRIAADRGFINYPFLATHDAIVARVRDDPAVQTFLATVRERWARFEG